MIEGEGRQALGAAGYGLDRRAILGAMAVRGLIEIQRRHHDLWNARNTDALRDLYDDEAVVHHLDGWPEPGPSVGRDAVFHQWELVRENWRADRLEILEITAVEDRVVTRQRWLAQSAHSDAPTEMILSSITRFREDKILDIVFYWDHADALAAAGVHG
jgi:ketosteroid isomerase-like protein